MKKTVLTYGIIAGIIASAGMVVSMAAGMQQMEGNWGMILGFTIMIVAFSFIFVGVYNYRQRYGGAAVSFGKAFKIGLMIALIGSTMYVATWLIDYYFFIPDFMDKYAESYLANLRTDGASATEIAAATKEMANYREMYKNPIFVVLITYSEILPIGILASLLAAAMLKKNETSKTVTQ